ncbi:MAG: hypothetical protein K1X53_14160 [Candidatus Sumerlaeaceae bacterium]|nr:hypothetical protein [Candidatus Sumerlaeaceae bacterium]
MKAITKPILCVFLTFLVSSHGFSQPPTVNGVPNRSQSGPWDNDVDVYRLSPDGTAKELARFDRAGVPTVARLADGRLMAAHQYFPETNDAEFDKVAVHFCRDEGKTWSPPEVISLSGLPDGMRFPFDPTLVPLPDGRVRLYFTSVKQFDAGRTKPAIYSAVSSNTLDFVVEPGLRFGIEGRPVIDCAVALHNGTFHRFSPDNGTGENPNVPQQQQGNAERPRDGVGYHAVSKDGLHFTREPDVLMGSGARWLGNALSDGKYLYFFGTSNRGMWMSSSIDGTTWTRARTFNVQGADPGAAMLKDGGVLLLATSPPRRGARAQQGGLNRPQPALRQRQPAGGGAAGIVVNP